VVEASTTVTVRPEPDDMILDPAAAAHRSLRPPRPPDGPTWLTDSIGAAWRLVPWHRSPDLWRQQVCPQVRQPVPQCRPAVRNPGSQARPALHRALGDPVMPALRPSKIPAAASHSSRAAGGASSRALRTLRSA